MTTEIPTPTPEEEPQRLQGLLVALIMALALLLIVLVMLLLALMAQKPGPVSVPVAGIQPLHSVYGPGAGAKPLFNHPMGAAFGRDGRIYVADTGNNRVVVFDKDARFLFEFGGLGVAKPAPGGTYSWKPGLLNYPTDVTTDENGDVYVADFLNDRIQVFNADGRFLRTFPSSKKKVGEGASGQNGTGIAVTSLDVRDGRVYATDRYQVVVFSTTGKFIRQFGKPGVRPGEFDHPNGIAVAPGSGLVVSDSSNGRVMGLTPSGKPLWVRGKAPAPGQKDTGGVFEVPRGLTIVADGTIIVADALSSQLRHLSATGEVLDALGKRGVAPGEFNFPTDVASQGDRLVIAEKGNNRVQVVILETR